MLRYEIKYTGRVQGVGFRITAQEIASRTGVVGWVKNEPDGSVQVLVEGEQAAVNTFVVSLFQTVNKDTRGQIEDFKITDSTVDEPSCSSFEIKH